MPRVELAGNSKDLEGIIKDWLNIAMFLLVTLLLAFMLVYGTGSKELILVLSSILITSVSVRYLLLYESKRLYFAGMISILLDAFIMYFISTYDHYGISKLYYLVLISDAIIFYKIRYGIAMSMLCYFFWILLTCNLREYSSATEFLPSFLSSAIPVIFTIMIMSIVKYVIIQHNKLTTAMRELEYAHNELDENSRRLEQMVLLQERNRIAGEVHDTIGHTLTAVLMEIEAGKRIMEKDPEEAAGKFEIAMEQVRKGLGEINNSIRAIKNEKVSAEEFERQIIMMISEIIEHTGVKIAYELSGIDEIPEELHVIIKKGLKEGLTNGIRHGYSDEFIFTLCATQENVEFILEDNGECPETINYGYGLIFMSEIVENFRGTMHIFRNANGSCVLQLKFPVGRNKDEINQSNDCR